MKITVLGGGHGSFAAAADLSERGHEVVFWRRDHAAFGDIMNAAPMQHFDTRDIHNEGTQPAVRAVADQLD